MLGGFLKYFLICLECHHLLSLLISKLTLQFNQIELVQQLMEFFTFSRCEGYWVRLHVVRSLYLSILQCLSFMRGIFYQQEL